MCAVLSEQTVNKLSENAPVLHHLLTPPPPQRHWLLLLTPPLLHFSIPHSPLSLSRTLAPLNGPHLLALSRLLVNRHVEDRRLIPALIFAFRHLSRLLLLRKVAVGSV